ncbi:MAG: MBL fold metallo-hydrolase [Streptococcaceae bacterium]|jgi:glyoxylase-like metal-dependent hydrolase (beta-lactamase superfamily II)|nr:MBL fold metallo-hydrolase [Streptococcaceae bacterium]
MRLTENVEMLEVKLPNGGIYHPTLTWDATHLVLFDTGTPDAVPYFINAIKAAGFNPKDLTDIILTHQDLDHIGGTLDLLKMAPNAKVYAYEVDAPFIEGKEMPTKLARQEQRLKSGEITETDPFYHFLKEGFSKVYLTVDVKLSDNEALDFCGGITTIFTPGHTPGHATFYLNSSKLMICGDAANVEANKLIGSNPAMTWDNEQAEQSLAKIKSYNLNGAICFHTGFLKL